MTIIEQIVSLLQADAALQALINGKIYPFSVPLEALPAIVYTFTPSIDDGIKEQNKLEIRIITRDYQQGLAIDSAVRRILLTIGDKPLNNSILSASLNGGGTLQDTASGLIHMFTFYNLLNRK